MRPLALDHMTAIDTTPAMLAQVARENGCDAICAFLRPMDVLPLMPAFEICRDRSARAHTKAVMADLGVRLELAYPFTLSARTDLADFAVLMECAADLGARAINALLYDREPQRRIDRFGELCDMAAGYGLKVAAEFYPPSQLPSLADALSLVEAVGRPGTAGVNVDLLHLVRSGGSMEQLRAAPGEAIVCAQVCDGPAMVPDDAVREASSDRMLCGSGQFDIAGFVAALPPDCLVSVEIPRDDAVATEPAATRAGRALDSFRTAAGLGK